MWFCYALNISQYKIKHSNNSYLKKQYLCFDNINNVGSVKKIIIVRHAKSSWVDYSLSDFDRPLDKRGIHDAPVMAERLRDEGHIPQLIFTSSAIRAKSTAAFFAQTFGVKAEETKALYHGEPDDYLEILTRLPEEVNCVALFGHNPGITFIANLIKPGCADNIPTCGIIVAEMPGTSWEKADWSSMHLVRILFPKENKHD